ncbi:hypothetical protein DP122_02990 [Clostridium tetani]|nr:hypothetical protein DP122_02990 [Clostridium tetani]RXI72961.1 hypothetical protein DP127_06040 [Clostridium tetani]RXM70750.1 hypothetical protein DP139_05230 [Clostridium tetani]RXM75505.1 hypothetical protein DP154_09085 [Clostridium tetani]RYU98748.1 hypothetical protein DP144_09090 [Clostridium tetani]
MLLSKAFLLLTLNNFWVLIVFLSFCHLLFYFLLVFYSKLFYSFFVVLSIDDFMKKLYIYILK